MATTPINADQFSAWINRMPPGEPRLIVKGEVQVLTDGWTSSLKPATSQGINPDILILDLSLIEPTGEVAQVISQVECRYEESPSKHFYTNVTVRLGGSEITIPVGTAD